MTAPSTLGAAAAPRITDADERRQRERENQALLVRSSIVTATLSTARAGDEWQWLVDELGPLLLRVKRQEVAIQEETTQLATAIAEQRLREASDL